MPVGEYFEGHGSEVMKNMKEEYGEKKGEQVFYATANKEGKTPDEVQDASYQPVTEMSLADINRRNAELWKPASPGSEE